MTIFEGSREANGLAVEKSMVEISQVFPQIFDRRVALPVVTYQEEPLTLGAIKGVGTEEFWLSPPYGRPRDIDYTTLKKLEESEWIQMCTNSIIDAIRMAEWEIVPKEKGESVPEYEIDEPMSFLEHLPSEETFDVATAKMLPDLLWYDAGAMPLIFPRGSFDDNGYLLDDPGQPVDLHVIDGRSVLIEAPPVGNRVRRYWQYSWMSPTSIPTPFDRRELMYFQTRPSSRGVYGTSALKIIQHVANYLLDSTLAQSKYYENGVHIGGQVDFPDVTNDEELKRRSLMIKQQFQGPRRYNKWITTGGNVKITPLQFTPQQMQWLDSQKWFAKVVMGTFKVAPTELGFTEDLNRATGIQQSISHKSRAVWPIMSWIERKLNQMLIWPFFSQNVVFRYKRDLDFEDQIKQLEVYQRKVQNGFWSLNQVRDDMGEPKWDAKYDEPFASGFGAFGQQPGQAGQTDIFSDQGQGSEQYGAGEGEDEGAVGKSRKFGKAANAAAAPGEPGFQFIPKVWDGSKVEGVTKKNAEQMMREISEAAKKDKQRVLEELKRTYAHTVA